MSVVSFAKARAQLPGLTSLSETATEGQYSDNDSPYEEMLIRCPFQECNCRVIPYKYRKQSFENNLVDVASAPECIYLDAESLEIVNPATAQKDKLGASVNGESKKFFKVNDAWDFDNIGVSRPADLKEPVIENKGKINIQRYLVCADCERGPIGFAGFLQGSPETESVAGPESENQRIANVKNLVYFLSADSVRYELR